MKLSFFPIKYIFTLLFIILNINVNVNANADILISYEELNFLIRIGALNKFSFTVENNKRFNGLREYEKSSTAGVYQGYGLGVAYSITSLDDKIATKTTIPSSEIIIGTVVYWSSCLDREPEGVNWSEGQTLDETCFKKYLSDIDQVSDNLKNKYELSLAYFFRYALIENLKSSLSDIYITDDNEKLVNYIRDNKLIKPFQQSASMPEIRYTLMFLL